jgi:NAD(P)-dependent dehydrogenase (short-subunit alcohol dehydrogenase family)
MRLEGRVAVITGASSGIGKAAAWLFVREGAKVIVSCHNAPRGEKVTEEITNAGFDATFVYADVASYADVERMLQTAIEKYGRLDIRYYRGKMAQVN